MPRHRVHKNARNTEYAQRAAFDLRIRAEEIHHQIRYSA